MRKQKKIMGILRKAARKLLIASFATFVLYMVAFSEGLGYKILNSSIERSTHPHGCCYEQFITGHVKVALNPILFPISHLCGSGVISADFLNYLIIHDRVSPYEAFVFVEATEQAQVIVFNELYKSIPVFFIMGLLVAYLTDKLIERIAETTKTSEIKLGDGWTR